MRIGRIALTVLLSAVWLGATGDSVGSEKSPDLQRAVSRGLEWLARHQSRLGRWTGNGERYPTAMTAMAGVTLLCDGSTTTQGKYADNVRRAVDYLVSRSCTNGLIGEPDQDDRYTYGHGFSMLFLSQVLGEEEDVDRREQLVDVLTRAVVFTGRAHIRRPAAGDTLAPRTAMALTRDLPLSRRLQGLRGCRNAGIPVPKEIIDKAIAYIRKCSLEDGKGGVQYNSRGGGGRPAISAAAIACLFNAGQYDSLYVPNLLEYCDKNLANISNRGFGHWHYAHYYYAQVKYREGGKPWETYRDKIHARILTEANPDGSWTQGYIGPVYTTSINLTILQLENGALPIYQR